MKHSQLPAKIGVADFDALHDAAPAWRGVIEAIAAAHSSEQVRQVSEGTVLVALIGQQQVLKLYPPFLRDHFEFEAAALQALSGRLSLPTPRFLARGEYQGWPYLLMSQLQGQTLTRVWPELDAKRQCELLSSLGALAAQVHALSVGALSSFAPDWGDFVVAQRAGCLRRQQRTGLPAHLLAHLPDFMQGELPQGPDVILTGEYTPMNLMVQDGRLCGMFDFGDGLVGPREYDWLGPLCFLGAGSAARVEAFFQGYGFIPDVEQRQALMRLLLLHRYSHLGLQIAMPGWQSARSFEELAALIWP